MRAVAAHAHRAVSLRHIEVRILSPRQVGYELRWAGSGFGKGAEAALALPDRPSIAVLPFINLSGDPEQEYFADGIVEDIITALSRMRWLFVIARNSSFTYKGRAVDVKQVGRELGVRYVLEGSVRKARSRLQPPQRLMSVSASALRSFERRPHVSLIRYRKRIVLSSCTAP
jgi:TolB-like protein